ncbi:MAG: ABC transporter ATP-binding protein [Bifidobacteriaceae bacterium]|jgi:peptide/nickel transport system ATP-binding protein|nr:ABC transporter ATP-binding protein [Bifidobacteriaceae bacterium]
MTAVLSKAPLAAQGTPIVQVKGLHVEFRGRERYVHAVRGLDLAVYPGEAVALVGESGSGKSVTALSLLGLTGKTARVTADEFAVGGRDVRTLNDRGWRQIRGTKIGLILQDALTSLDPLRTVGQEIHEALVAHGGQKKGGAEAVEALLAEVGFPDPAVRAHQYAHQLSGGLRQRALIASALAGNPELLVADEPTTALDVTVQAQILDLLGKRRDAGTAVLLISHDLAVVSRVADRVLVMRDGLVVEQGPTAQLLQDPRHPYTKALLRAVPSAATRGQRLSGGAPSGQPGPGHEGESGPGARAGRAAPDRQGPVLAARGVSKVFKLGGHRQLRAVVDVDVRVEPGGKLGIVGESGSGKSTLARILLGLMEPDQGSVEVMGQPWRSPNQGERRGLRRAVQFVSQDAASSFDPRYTVEQIVAEPLRTTARSKAERLGRVREALALTHLEPSLLQVVPRNLSGGQRQRVAIARALALEPEVLICDEPVSALDVSIQAQILDLLAELNERTGTALVFISHDLGVVHHLVDDVLVMHRGRVVEEGPVDRVFTAPSHPYTQGLLAAVPRLQARGAEAPLGRRELVANAN